jgi:tetratricopeptide (TPR) repeat protein
MLLRSLSWGLSAAWLAASAVFSMTAQSQTSPQLAEANAALQAGEADKALSLLHSQSDANSAEAANLQCRVRLTLEQWDAAVNQCQQAVRLDPQNSEYHVWLGRAFGEKADRASFLSAYSLAKHVPAEFREAVRLDPRNAEALSDLGEFYEQAPPAVGGGVDKAQAIATQLDSVDPARAHQLRGRIAEHDKDFDAAEHEYKQAIAASPHPASAWIDLAGFYRHRKQWTQMESAVQSAVASAQHDKRDGPSNSLALFDGASILSETNRNLPQAAKIFDDYLAGSAKSEEGPAFVAHLRLARIEAQLGESAAADRDRAAAAALASEYRPAQVPAAH